MEQRGSKGIGRTSYRTTDLQPTQRRAKPCSMINRPGTPLEASRLGEFEGGVSKGEACSILKILPVM